MLSSIMHEGILVYHTQCLNTHGPFKRIQLHASENRTSDAPPMLPDKVAPAMHGPSRTGMMTDSQPNTGLILFQRTGRP